LPGKRSSFRRFAGTKGSAAFAAVAVFGGLYLAEGIRLFGRDSVWYVLAWPWAVYGGWDWWLWHLPVILAAFAAVGFYVYRLNLLGQAVEEDTARVQALESELAGIRQQAAICQSVLVRCQEELQAAREDATKAKARADAAEANARASSGAASPGADGKFQAAKRAFARLYHPDNIKADGLDKVIRAEIFKEFWRELESIQKAGKGGGS
jgi:hypothetical protein